MITPFDKQGNIDYFQVAQLTEFLIARGVHCLYPLGTTGEMLRLSVQERKAVAETVVRTAAGRVIVYIHTGAMCEADTIELTKHAYAIGADGVGVVSPMFFSANEREMERYYVEVASSVPFPVYLYNIPQCSANDISTAVARRVAEQCPNVVGIKYSYADFLRTNEYIGIREHFSVVHGADRLFLGALAIGCSGTVSGVSCAFPEPFVAIYEAFQAGDLERARHCQQIANEFCEALKSGSNMAYFKEALAWRGVEAGHMRAPQLDLEAEEAARLHEQLAALSAKAEAGGLQLQHLRGALQNG